jgi:hypothetical protein
VLALAPIFRYVAQRAVKQKKFEIAALINASAGIGMLAAFRGIKFEETLLAMLAEGAVFTPRELGKHGPSKGRKRQLQAKAPGSGSLTVPASKCSNALVP